MLKKPAAGVLLMTPCAFDAVEFVFNKRSFFRFNHLMTFRTRNFLVCPIQPKPRRIVVELGIFPTRRCMTTCTIRFTCYLKLPSMIVLVA